MYQQIKPKERSVVYAASFDKAFWEGALEKNLNLYNSLAQVTHRVTDPLKKGADLLGNKLEETCSRLAGYYNAGIGKLNQVYSTIISEGPTYLDYIIYRKNRKTKRKGFKQQIRTGKQKKEAERLKEKEKKKKSRNK